MYILIINRNNEIENNETKQLIREQVNDRLSFEGWLKIVDIMNKIQGFKNFIRNTVSERYYTPMFVMDYQGIKGNDQYIYFHSNKLCIIGIAPGHILFKNKNMPNSISFQGNNRDLSLNLVSGRNKKGGYWIDRQSILCEILCDNNIKYKLHGCVKGHLIELNEKISNDPLLLYNKPYSDGYVAIINPNLNEIMEVQPLLLTAEEYLEKQKDRIY